MKKISVLIIEDEPIIAADLEDRLHEMGYETAGPFSYGEEAVEWFSMNNVDIVLMDIQLSGQMDGVETAYKIQEIRSVPLVFLTSNADPLTFARAKKTHPAAFLTKPFRGKDLQHSIELAISRSEPEPDIPETKVEIGSSNWFGDRVFIKFKDRMIRIFLADILWIEADDYYCRLITLDKEYLITQTLKQLGETLAVVPGFLRIHRSYIVNSNHIEEIGDLFVVIHKKQIPISKSAKEELTAWLIKI